MDVVIAVPIIIGLGEIIKRTELLDTRFLPLVLLIVSVSFFSIFGVAGWQDNALLGVISALSAMGLWSGTRTTLDA